MKNVIYHHRTQCKGAEGVHVKGVQQAMLSIGLNVKDISLVAVPNGLGEDRRQERSPRMIEFYSLLAKWLPNVCFKILEMMYPIRSFISTLIALRRVPKSERKETFIYDRYAYFSFGLPFVAKLLNIPLVLEVNTTCLDYDVRKILFRKIIGKTEGFCFRNAKLIVVVSSYLKNLIEKKYGINPDKIIVIPNAVDPNHFLINSNNTINTVVQSFIDNKMVIGFVGVFVPWHGVDFLIDVFERLLKVHSEGKKLGLLLVGDGPIREEIEQKIKNKKLQNSIFITGMVPHEFVKYYINSFDIAVMPDSNHFGSPMKIFEYMVMGKALLVPSYSPIEEVIADGVDGIIFKKQDIDHCLSKLKFLVDDHLLRQELGANAKRKVLRYYTWDDNVKKVVSELKTVLR